MMGFKFQSRFTRAIHKQHEGQHTREQWNLPSWEFSVGQTSTQIVPMDLQEFCKALPKIELHAHLNGSISSETLKKFSSDIITKRASSLEEYENKISFTYVPHLKNLSKTDRNEQRLCFKTFDVIYSVTNSPQAVTTATRDVIREFYEDNVIYLELRSTPRAVAGRMTKVQYINAIISGIQSAKMSCPGIIVKLLISVNRKHIYETAQENIELAIDLHEKYPEHIVGIDLSGDPTKGDAYIELLQSCRNVGLKIAAHCGEVPNEVEVVDILRFKPDRLGHCTCIHPNLKGSQILYEMLLESQIPVELCLTSNVMCKTVPSYEQHHFAHLYQARHPICIATDDKGVFDTTLSQEYEILGKYFRLPHTELQKISLMSVQYAFATDEEKAALTRTIEAFN